ncbi:tetratricopeptide repeat protein [Tumebacillus algifaecis]|nr:tetratricopeptide repeat protein [Tumebacillus algifaecis]
MKKLFSIMLAAALLLPPAGMEWSGSAVATAASDKKFQPGVEEFIQGNYLGHANELPDPNESVEVLQSYLTAKGSPKELDTFKNLVKKFPDSRHANVGLAMAYYNEFAATKDSKLAKLALQHELKAAEIALTYGKVQYTGWIKQIALDAGTPEAAVAFFDKALAAYPGDFEAALHKAETLGKMGKKAEAEASFKQAVDHRPAGNIDAHASYAEFLLEQGRYEEAALNTILIGESAYYISFLHGYALEKLGKGEEAQAHYAKFAEFSQSFPAPAKFKIERSAYQLGLSFEQPVGAVASAKMSPDNTLEAVIMPEATTATTNLSWAVTCEAGGETVGGMRMVGWSIRQRVNRGSTKVNGTTCLSVTNSGTTMDDKYGNVICQSSQYSGVTCNSSKDVTKCTNSNVRTTTTNQVAFDVYNGLVPDPYTGYCPTGTSSSTTYCTATCTGATNNTTSFTVKTPHSFLAYSHAPLWGCAINAGAVCGNGGGDNYFDYNNANN